LGCRPGPDPNGSIAISESTPVERFFSEFLEDWGKGGLRSLESYLSEFPAELAPAIKAAFDTRTRVPPPDKLPEGGPVQVGGRIGAYVIREELGRGGQGVVFLADDTRLQRKVALKVLDGVTGLSDARLGRFNREAHLASRLDHPGICTIYEAGEASGMPFLAMQYVRGETLANRIRTATEAPDTVGFSVLDLDTRSNPDPERATTRDGPTTGVRTTQTSTGPVLEILATMEQVARALHAAHESGVIHRDIKPGNIMITPEEQPVVLDFGLAGEMEGDGPTLTRTGDLFGTPAYMAPEQLMAQRIRVDRRVDIWALGVTVYEAVTLTRPFEAPTREGLYQSILTREPRPAQRLNPAIPRDLDVVLKVALEKDRDRRYQTALDFAEDLRAVREGQPIRARPPSMLTRGWRLARRNPVSSLLLTSLLLVLTVGLPVLAYQRGLLQAAEPDRIRGEQVRMQTRFDGALGDGLAALLDDGGWVGGRRPADTAPDHFRRALELRPNSLEAAGGLAVSLLEHDPRETLKIIERIRADAAALPSLTLVQADALRALGRAAEADATLKEARVPSALSVDRFINALHTLSRSLRTDEGAARRAVELLTLALVRLPASKLPYHELRSVALSRCGSPRERVEAVDLLITGWPDSPRAHHYAGALLKDQDPVRAERLYRKALDLGAGVQTMNNLGNLLATGRRYDEAMAMYEEAMRREASYKLAPYNLGDALMRLNRPEDALPYLESATKADPGFGEAWAYLGRALQLTGRFEDAQSAFDRAEGHKPLDGGFDKTMPDWREETRSFMELEETLQEQRTKGEPQVPDDKRMAAGRTAFYKGWAITAARLFRSETERRPKQIPNIAWYGVCAAACAGLHRETGVRIGEQERRTWRDHARGWLEAQVNAYQRLHENNRIGREALNVTLRNWMDDPHLKPYRPGSFHPALSPEERRAWTGLWSRMEAALKAEPGT